MNARARVIGGDIHVQGQGFRIVIHPDTAPPPAAPTNDARAAVAAPALEAFPFGLESKAAAALIKSGRLPAVRIGRRWYAKRADLESLVTPAAPPSANDDGEELERARAARRAAGSR